MSTCQELLLDVACSLSPQLCDSALTFLHRATERITPACTLQLLCLCKICGTCLCCCTRASLWCSTSYQGRKLPSCMNVSLMTALDIASCFQLMQEGQLGEGSSHGSHPHIHDLINDTMLDLFCDTVPAMWPSLSEAFASHMLVPVHAPAGSTEKHLATIAE